MKKLIYNVILLLDVLIVVVAVSFAWFAKNTKASGDGIAVSTETLQTYELASEGEFGRYSSGEYADLLGLQREKGTRYELPGGTVVFASSSEKHSIEWMVTPDSHINNELLPGIAEELYPKLQPGAYGSISFYILPPAAAVSTQALDIELRLIPYARSAAAPLTTPMPGENPVVQLLNGHLLFFREHSGGQYSGWIEDGAFSVEVEGNTPKKVTLYWIWPLYYSNLSGGSDPIFSDALEQAEIINDINTNPSKYFYYAGGIEPEIIPTDPVQLLLFNSSNYNRADEQIGINISYVTAEIALR